MSAPSPVLELSGVTKDYRGLRPLRIEHLSLGPGEHVAILGFDRTTADVFIQLVTGAALPDAGEIRVSGRSTAAVTDSAAWLELADAFGIVGERAVLLDGFSVLQNLALPFSLAVDPLEPSLRAQAIALAREIELPPSEWERPAGDLEPGARLRVRLGRAFALEPKIVLFEHPSADLPRADVATCGRAVRTICERRGVTSLMLTADPELAATAGRVLKLEPASGRLTGAGGWRLFGRLSR